MEMILPRSLVLYNVFELRTYLLCFVSFCDLFSGVCVQNFRSPLQEKNNFGRHFDTVFPFLIYHKTENERILWLLVMLIVCKSVIFFVGTERDCSKLRQRNESKAKMPVAVINVVFNVKVEHSVKLIHYLHMSHQTRD